MSSIDLSKLKKARDTYERFRQDMLDDRDQAGAIQSFKFSYELAWKTMKRVLESCGQEVGSPKDTFRKAALEKLIDNPEVWFAFLTMRNLTSHTYQQENVNAIIQIFEPFSKELNELIMRIEVLK
jgi:nucleotidyltransferase substrate binding protein (TIGR01987 family)